MNLEGVIVGAAVFLIIGICHPVVIKMEYLWTKRSWWVLLVAGLSLAVFSLFIVSSVGATIAGAAAFSCFWGIYEIFEQEKRVLRGSQPENPARHEYYESLRKSIKIK